jgi:hypothetical protein
MNKRNVLIASVAVLSLASLVSFATFEGVFKYSPANLNGIPVAGFSIFNLLRFSKAVANYYYTY